MSESMRFFPEADSSAAGTLPTETWLPLSAGMASLSNICVAWHGPTNHCTTRSKELLSLHAVPRTHNVRCHSVSTKRCVPILATLKLHLLLASSQKQKHGHLHPWGADETRGWQHKCEWRGPENCLRQIFYQHITLNYRCVKSQENCRQYWPADCGFWTMLWESTCSSQVQRVNTCQQGW